jgi:transcriptional regulator with XRE-family HTH domain
MRPNKKSSYDNENQMRQKSVAEFLKEYRLQSGLTQVMLSEYAELNRSSVIRLESGMPVSFQTICKYASGLELPLHQLFLEIE